MGGNLSVGCWFGKFVYQLLQLGIIYFMGLILLTARMDGRTMTYRAVSPLKPYEQPNEYTSSGSTIHSYGGGKARSYEE